MEPTPHNIAFLLRDDYLVITNWQTIGYSLNVPLGQMESLIQARSTGTKKIEDILRQMFLTAQGQNPTTFLLTLKKVLTDTNCLSALEILDEKLKPLSVDTVQETKTKPAKKIETIKVEGKIITRLAELFHMDSGAEGFNSRFCSHTSLGFLVPPAVQCKIRKYMKDSEFYDAYLEFFNAFYSLSPAPFNTIGTILVVLDEIGWMPMKEKILAEDWTKY